MLWSIFVTYIISQHGLGGFSGLINGLIAAVIDALSILMSEPTAKTNVKRTRVFVLSLVTLNYIHYINVYRDLGLKQTNKTKTGHLK